MMFFAITLAATVAAAPAPTYPPLSAYMMPRAQEIALARSAAPENISSAATIKVLTPTGYTVAVQGSNGFVCMVERGWGAPSVSPAPLRELVYDGALRAPICFDPNAAATYGVYQEFRAKLGMARKTPDEISQAVKTAYAKGTLPKMDRVSFAYMFSADMDLGPGAGHFHPHVMVFAPGYTNDKLGGNQFGGMQPFVSDDAGTPFTVVVISVDPNMAVKMKM